MSARLRVLVAGCGQMGASHARAYQRMPADVEIVGLVSRGQESRRRLNASLDGRRPEFSDYADALASTAPDAVCISTYSDTHADYAVAALEAGAHVFVEKPMTLTRKSAEKAVEACKAAGVTLGVGFNRRFQPSFVEMMNRIRAGQIGKVLHIEGAHSGPTGYGLKPDTWRSSRVEAPGGGMTARGVHTLDAMIQIGGLVTSVYAFSDNRNLPQGVDMDDTTTMLLKFSSGVTGYLSALFTTGELYRVHVFGTKGWLELRGDTELTFRGVEGAPEKITLPAADKEKAELEAFADAVAAKKPFAVPAEDAINGAAVLEAIVASAAKGKPVQIK